MTSGRCALEHPEMIPVSPKVLQRVPHLLNLGPRSTPVTHPAEEL